MEELSRHNITKKIIVFIAFTFSLVLVLFYSSVLNWLTEFTEKNIRTYDGVIEPNQFFIIEIALLFFIFLGICVGLVLIFNWHKKTMRFLNSLFKLDDLRSIVLNDSLTKRKYLARNIFVFSTVFSIIWHLKYLLFGDTIEKEFYKEPILEHVSSFLFFASAILLIISVFKVSKQSISIINKKIIKRYLIVLSIFLLLVFLEEISWGQQYFSWEASGVFKESNFQSETNFHNFINPLFRFVYPFAGMGFFAILFLFWFFYKEEKSFWLQLVLPHQSLIVLSFVMACSSFIGHSEIFEEYASVFVLLYSIRVFTCLYYPVNIKTHSNS